MRTYKITSLKELDKFKDDLGYTIDGNAEFSFNVVLDGRLKVEGYLWIEAGSSIEAGDWIEAGDSIEAGSWIKAGGWIEVLRGGITVGTSLSCKGSLKFALKLFAGTSPYSWCADCSKEVRCGKLEGGTIVYGDLVETGLPDAPKETIEIGGIKYDKDEVEAKLKDIKPIR